MKINTTIGKLADISSALRKLAVQDLSVKPAYRLMRTIKKMDEHMEFYDERYNALLHKYCDHQENGRWIPKSDADREQIEKEMKELRNIEVELDDVTICVISAGENVKISSADMIALEGYVEFEIEAEKNKKEENDNGNP